MTFRQKGAAALVISTALALSGAFLWGDVHVISASISGQSNDDGLPLVKITAPKNNSTLSWNSLVNYSILVTYQGKSTQYQEIPSNEVLLETTYITDLSAMAGKPAPTAAPTPTGLLYITKSTCLGCHQFKAKAVGPSFAAIANRFPAGQTTSDTLSQHIRAGSTGVWGGRQYAPARAVYRRPSTCHCAVDHERCSQSEYELLRGNGGNISDGGGRGTDLKGRHAS